MRWRVTRFPSCSSTCTSSRPALHGVHLLTGVSILLWLTWDASKPGFLARRQNRIEIYGLYWHFIDLIWIMVFPILYVVGR